MCAWIEIYKRLKKKKKGYVATHLQSFLNIWMKMFASAVNNWSQTPTMNIIEKLGKPKQARMIRKAYVVTI